MKLNPKVFGPCLALGISSFVMISTESLLSISFTSSLARYGGDEFTVLCKNAKAEDAYFVALRIRDKLAQIRVREHPQLRISASIGVAAADSSFDSVADWISAADSALYSAKTAGRDQVIDATHQPANRQSNSPATIPMPESKTALPVREQDAVV